ncbi:unnamed protein product [Eruca vesicaria subsp. sativa]|uniref:Uncharacterized protein n=1 Tax=Eruca vesicaria subsp. sativa TaxID=29727 RepID=A0ABC8J1C8_ERUVS|nr:unnamed protein product [Eruca vesicaria subsp. sativa]
MFSIRGFHLSINFKLGNFWVLVTVSLEWMELSASGSLPPPRCGHTATMVEKRLLVFGGRGGGGPIMGFEGKSVKHLDRPNSSLLVKHHHLDVVIQLHPEDIIFCYWGDMELVDG